MVNFKSDSFDFYSFDTKSPEHLKALYELEDDPQIRRWFGNFGEYFKDTTDIITDLNGKFLVGRQDEIIGFISLYDSFKFINLDYGLLPAYRGIRLDSEHTIGSKLLLETSEVILKNYAQIEYLRCYIDLNNIRSISTAKKAGFTCHKELIVGYADYRKANHFK